MSSVDPVADISEDDGEAHPYEDGKKSQEGLKSQVTGITGGESKTCVAAASWKGDLHNHFYPDKQKDQTRKEDSQKEDENPGKVMITISGKRSEPMPPLEMLPVLIKDGNISVTGSYDQSNITTKACCNSGIIVELEAIIKPTKMQKCICHTLWTLDGSSIDDIGTTLSVSHQTLFELKERIQRLYDAVLQRVGQGSLVLKFGHYTRRAAERMVENKDKVVQEIRAILEKLCMSITDVTLVLIEDAEEEELDEIAPLPTSAKRRKKMYDPSEGESSGHHSMSSHSSRSLKEEEVETETNMEELQKDKEVTGCEVCSSLCQDRDQDTDVNILVCHSDASYIMPTRRLTWPTAEKKKGLRIQRFKKTEEIMHKVSALRNTGGGVLFVHVTDVHTGEKPWEFVCELISFRLHNMLSPGELYGDIYKITKHVDHDNVIKVTASHSTKVITSDSCTKTRLDNCSVSTSVPELHSLLFGNRAISNSPAVLRGVRNISEDGINVVFKRWHETDKQLSSPDYCFHSLHLNEYISALAKNATGGSFFLGGNDKTMFGGIPVDVIGNKITYSQALRDIIAQNMLVIKNINQKEQYDLKELVEVEFHRVGYDRCVIEVAVRPVNGCVFTDKNGPIAAKLNEAGKLVRMSVMEYLERLKR